MGVKIARHTGEVNTIPSDARGIVRHRPNLAAGKAVAAVGRALTDVADHRAKRQLQMEQFQAANDLRAFQSNVDAARAEAVESANEGGVGLTEGFMGPGGKFDALSAKLIAGARNAEIQKKFAILMGEDGSARIAANNAIAEDELGLQHAFIDANIGDASDDTSNRIFVSPGNYQTDLAAVNALIDAAPRSNKWKRAERKKWGSIAVASLIAANLRDDPDGLWFDLGNGTRKQRFDFLVQKIVRVESSNDPNAEGAAGELGLMQLMPDTARGLAKELGDTNYPQPSGPSGRAGKFTEAEKAYLLEPVNNIRYGSHLIRGLLDEFADVPEGRGLQAALIAYNAGPTKARKWLAADGNWSVVPKSTVKYVAKVMGGLGESVFTAGKSGQDTVSFSLRSKDHKSYDPIDPSKDMKGTKAKLFDIAAQAFNSIGETDVQINSGFRDPATNKKAGGVDRSQHLGGKALDFNVGHLDMEDRIRLIAAFSAMGIGGIGVGKNTIHIDLGGTGRSWGYNGPNGEAGGPVPPWAASVIARHKAGSITIKDVGMVNIAPPFQHMPAASLAAASSKAKTASTKKTAEGKAALALIKATYEDLLAGNIVSIIETGKGTEEYEGKDPADLLSSLGVAKYRDGLRDIEDAHDFFRAKTVLDSAVREISIDPEGKEIAGEDPIEVILIGLQADLKKVRGVDRERKQKVVDKIEDYAEEVRKERRTEPGRAATRFPEVREAIIALSALPPGQITPQHYQDLIRLMYRTQKAMGIPDALRQPLPPAMAAQVAFMFGRNVPERIAAGRGTKGNKEDFETAARDMFNRLHRDYGEFADEVLVQALDGFKTPVEATKLLVGLMNKVMRENNALNASDEEDAAATSELDAQSQFGRFDTPAGRAVASRFGNEFGREGELNAFIDLQKSKDGNKDTGLTKRQGNNIKRRLAELQGDGDKEEIEQYLDRMRSKHGNEAIDDLFGG